MAAALLFLSASSAPCATAAPARPLAGAEAVQAVLDFDAADEEGAQPTQAASTQRGPAAPGSVAQPQEPDTGPQRRQCQARTATIA